MKGCLLGIVLAFAACSSPEYQSSESVVQGLPEESSASLRIALKSGDEGEMFDVSVDISAEGSSSDSEEEADQRTAQVRKLSHRVSEALFAARDSSSPPTSAEEIEEMIDRIVLSSDLPAGAKVLTEIKPR